VVGHKVAVVAVVVVHLATHVEAAVGQGVVEQAIAHAGVGFTTLACDVEGDVFVQRVGAARAVTHGVQVAHAVALAGAVGVAGALAQAEVGLAAITLQVVVNLFIPPAEVVALRGTVGGAGLPAPLVPVFPAAEQTFERDGQANRSCADLQLCALFLELECGQRKAAHVKTVTALDGQVFQARRHRPAARHLQLALRQHQHADDVFFEHPDMSHGAAVAGQHKMVVVAELQGEYGGMVQAHGGNRKGLGSAGRVAQRRRPLASK
jgi:hypothetical protein